MTVPFHPALSSRATARTRRWTLGSLSALLVAAALHAGAEPVTIYRCTDAAGTLTVQNAPCPPGSQSQTRQMQGVGATPTAAPQPVAPLFPAVPPERGGWTTTVQTQDDITPPRILDSASLRRASGTPPRDDAEDTRLPPPPVFRCTTYDNDSYLAEDDTPAPRCLPLRTVGLDGNPDMGAGQACEVKRDRCARVPDGEACDAWTRLAREAEARWRFAHPDNARMRQDAYERLARMLAESRCGG